MERRAAILKKQIEGEIAKKAVSSRHCSMRRLQGKEGCGLVGFGFRVWSLGFRVWMWLLLLLVPSFFVVLVAVAVAVVLVVMSAVEDLPQSPKR